jgi:hypothetical protein
LQRQIDNQLTRVQGKVEVAALDGALLAAHIEAEVRMPGSAAPRSLRLDYADDAWVALDAAARTRCSSAEPARLPEPARAALALLPPDLLQPRKWIPAAAGARLAADTVLGGAPCANLEWSSPDGLSSGQWLIARSDGLPRLCVETRDTPGVEIEVRRWTLRSVERAPGFAALPSASTALPDGWTEVAACVPPAPIASPTAAQPLSLAHSVEPLRAAFDAAAGVPRVIGTFAPS